MSLIHNKLSSEVLFALLTELLLLVPGGQAHAQSVRSVQMSVFEFGQAAFGLPGNGTGNPSTTDTDIVSFAPGSGQPSAANLNMLNLPTSTIMYSVNPNTSLYSLPSTYDWSRIIAVGFDEPYGPQYSDLLKNGDVIDHLIKYPNGSPVCPAPPAAVADIKIIDTLLQQRVTELKALAPRARFWVNFTEDEANWMAGCDTQTFNRDYIDVISADWTADGGNNDIVRVQPFLDAVSASPPGDGHQQLALVPGTYSQPVDQRTHIQGFFQYANNKNQTPGCNLPLGSRGVTGFYDGCPVWIIFGWLSGDYQQDSSTVYRGLRDPSSGGMGSVASNWQAEVAIPVAASLSPQLKMAQIVMPILKEFASPSSDNGTLTVGSTTSVCGAQSGYTVSVMGSYSPTGLTGGKTVGALFDQSGSQCSSKSILNISGFSSDPGSGWLTSVTCSGVKNATPASYSYASGIGQWAWNTPFGFGSLSVGANVSCTIAHD